jgi:hypothetical protein
MKNVLDFLWGNENTEKENRETGEKGSFDLRFK